MNNLELAGAAFRSVRSSLAALIALLLCVGIAGRALAAPAPAALQQNLSAPFAEGELVLTFEQGLDESQIQAFYAQFSSSPGQQVSEIENLARSPRYTGPAMRRVRVPEGMERDLIARMEADARVRYAELNTIIAIDATPNDTDFGQLWGMHNTGQTGGYAYASGSPLAAPHVAGSAAPMLAMQPATSTAELVINEIDYDQPGTDTAEFIEIKNVSGAAINLTGYKLELVNGNGGGAAVYQTIFLYNASLAAGDYWVVCANSANTVNCDQGVTPNTNLIQNGAPDAVALRNVNALVDTVSYDGNTGAPYTETSGVGLTDSSTLNYLGISRFPDGVDTDVNNVDLSARCISPGTTNLATSSGCLVPNAFADLAITKTDTPDPVIAGTNLSYQVTVSNLGPFVANSFTVTDPLPSNARFVSATPSGPGAVCTPPPVGTLGGTLSCTFGPMPTTLTASIAIVVGTCPGVTCGPNISNTASVSLAAPQVDPVSGNNSATAATAVQAQSNLNITKTGNPSNAYVGQNVVYTLVVDNTGPSNAAGVVVIDNLPPNFVYVGATVSNAGSCSAVGTVVTCSLGVVGAPNQCGTPIPQSVTIQITATAGNNPGLSTPACPAGLVTNTATVASTNCLADTGTRTASAQTCVGPTPADLSITKTDTPDPVVAGTNLSYQIVVTNLGPGTAANFTVNDPLPSNARFVSALPSGPGANCTTPAVGALGGTLSCNFGPLAVNATASIAVVVGTCPGVTCGPNISNTATVSLTPPQTDPVSGNNTATAPTAVQARSNLTITKTGNPSDVVVGQDVVYTLVINNTGPSNAAAVVVTDNLPPNFVYVGSQVSNGGSCSAAGTVVTCNLGVVGAPNQCGTIIAQTVTIQISATAGNNPGLAAIGCPAGLVTNTASVRSANCLADTGTLSSSAQTCVHPPPPTPSEVEYNLVLPPGARSQVIPLGGGLPDATESDASLLALPGPLGLNGPVGLDQLPSTIPVGVIYEAGAPDPCLVGLVETQILVSEAGTGDVFNFPAVPETVVTWNSGLEVVSCEVILPANGSCDFSGRVVNFNYGLLAGESFEGRVVLRFVGGLGNNSTVSGVLCLNWDGLVDRLPDRLYDPADDQECGQLSPIRVYCPSLVDPNRQSGKQVHLPILNFQGQDDVCRTWIEVQYIGCDPSKAVLVTWGEPGFCPPQAAGPLKVECTGLLNPGSSWNLLGAQIPTGSKSGILFKFTAKQLGELPGNPGPTLADDFGFDDVAADLMCETLFFGVVGDSDDYRRFKKAYNEGLSFASIPQGTVAGEGILAVEVLRHCPGDITPGVEVSSKYNGIAGAHLGFYDPIFGGFGYYVPLLYAEKAGLNSVMYIQNGGLECSSIEIWFKAQDDCLRARICEIFTLAPGETYQWDASDCVGPDWQGSAWLRSSQEMGVVVDIFGRDILMSYTGEPAPYDYVVGFDDNGAPQFDHTPTTGEHVAYGPLMYSEYQGWDTGVQVQNLSQVLNAKVKVYFLDRSGDVITTLVDWICPRGSQTFFLPLVAGLPGNWVGSIRVESQEWWTPGTNPVEAPYVVGVATLMKYSDVARTATEEAIAYNLLPEHKSYTWQVGFGPGGRSSGVALIAVPSLLKDLDGTGTTSELAIMNLVAKPGFTDFAIYIYDQNGLLDFVCEKLHDRQVEYIDLQTWGYVNNGFKGSALISATFWEHEVFDGGGNFVRNLVGMGAVSVERTGTRLGEDVPGDEAAGSRGIPLAQDSRLAICRGGFTPRCPGQPAASPSDGDCGPVQASGTGGAIPDAGGGIFVSSVSPSFVGDCAVRDVNLTLDVTHTFVGDLNVSLLHGGTSSSLFNAICGADDNIDVTLDDDNPQGRGNIGNAASCAGIGPVGGGNTYASQSGSALDAFNGQSAAGDWTLQIVDTFGGDTGTVNSWSLVLDTRRR